MDFKEDIYRRVVEAIPEGIWVVNPQGQTIFSNRRMANILGVDYDSMPDQWCFAWVYPEELEEAQRQFALGLSGERSLFEFRLCRADGSPIWVSISSMPIFDETGAPVALLGLFSDITERKNAEAALKESEERFRHMANSAPVMLWMTDTEKGITFVNKTWLDFTGRTLEQELGTGWADGVHPDDLPGCFDVFSAAFDALRSFQTEIRLRRADGEFRSTLYSGVPRFLPGGTFAGYIGSDVDITDLQSEERFRQMAENIDQVFWMFDLDRQEPLYISPAFEELCGHSPAPLYQVRRWLMESIHQDDREKFAAFIAKASSAAAQGAYRIVRPDGSVRWIEDRGFPVYNAEGRAYRVAGIAEDVTSRRELEEELRQAHKMEAVGRLAGGVAHDFNNLLTIIGGHSQMLLDETGDADPRRDRLKQILSATNRASTLTSQLLAFSRRKMLQPKLVNLNHVLTNMQALLRPLIGEHTMVRSRLDPKLSRILVDPYQIEEIVMNLAANSRDAMPEGGQFTIETSMADSA